jgi:hypothetical protein
MIFFGPEGLSCGGEDQRGILVTNWITAHNVHNDEVAIASARSAHRRCCCKTVSMAVQDRGQTSEDARSRPTACSRLFLHPVNLLILADNTWNAYYCAINETVVLDNAKFMNESGLLEAGYEYFVIDGTGPFYISYFWC